MPCARTGCGSAFAYELAEVSIRRIQASAASKVQLETPYRADERNSCRGRTMNDTQELLAANAAYYRAFNTRDFVGMSRIWADNPVSCIHPGWPALTGRATVLDSYRRILDNPVQEPVECRDATAFVSGSEGRVLCVEIVDGLALAVTNWFTRAGGAWRMIHHQATAIAVPLQESAPPGQRLN